MVDYMEYGSSASQLSHFSLPVLKFPNNILHSVAHWIKGISVLLVGDIRFIVNYFKKYCASTGN